MSSFLAKLFVELVGTFVFLSVIANGSPGHAIAIALLAVIYFGGSVSGGHFNPAVTIMQLANNAIGGPEALGYIAVQLLGGLLALGAFILMKKLRAY